MSQNYTDINTHLVMNDMTEAQFSNLQSVDPDQLYLTEDTSADENLSNITDTAEVTIAHLAAPSGTYTELSHSSGSYTAVSDGYFYVQYSITGSGGWCTLECGNGIKVGGIGSYWTGTKNRWFMPVKKGDSCSLYFDGVSIDNFRFYYAVGAESEAS